MKEQIRVLALAVLRREDGKFLLEKGLDSVKNEVFYRPMGGGVEFGEKGADALAREFKEEIGKSIKVEAFLGAVENLFEWQGQAGHQIILFYRCAFTDKEDYKQEYISRIDGNSGHTYWRSVEDIRGEAALLHPYQVMDML